MMTLKGVPDTKTSSSLWSKTWMCYMSSH